MPNILEEGRAKREKEEKIEVKATNKKSANKNDNDLIDVLLGDDPPFIVNTLLDALRQGMSGEEAGREGCICSCSQNSQFNTRNEFTDWDAALHTFTFANAVHQCLRRISTSLRVMNPNLNTLLIFNPMNKQEAFLTLQCEYI